VIWYRITLDQAGNVTSCKPVEKPRIGSGVFYIQALDAAQAYRKVAAEYARIKVKERRDRYRKKGLCTECGNTPDKGPNGKPKRRCPVCLARNEVHQERSAQRAAGAKVTPLPKGGGSATQRQAEHDESVRLQTLFWVKRLWTDSPNVGKFSKSLNDEISRLLEAKRVKAVA